MAEIPPLLAAADHVLAILAEHRFPACLIGGLAVQRWGEPRATQDVDVSVLAAYGREGPVIATLLDAFAERVEDAARFALDHRVVLLRNGAGVKIDVALAAHPFEEEAIDASTRWSPGEGLNLRVSLAEHLIVYKLVAARAQDLVDVTNIVRRQGKRLDVGRIRRWGREFAELKEDPALLRPFEDAWRNVSS